MNEFDYIPVYKFKDPTVILHKIGKVLLWSVIPGILVILALATQVNFTSQNWDKTTAGIFFIISIVLTVEFLLVGIIFFFTGSETNRAPNRITLYGAELILYFDNNQIKRFNLASVINITATILTLNKTSCKALIIEYPQGKRNTILTQHIPDQYIEAILATFKYYKSLS